MGSNTTPRSFLLRTSSPLVGTGVERIVAKDSGSTVTALSDGGVIKVDGGRIVIKREQGAKKKSYPRSSGFRCRHLQPDQVPALQPGHLLWHEMPLVRIGDKVKKGDVIADGPGTACRRARARPEHPRRPSRHGTGYNFEDSIILSSENLIKSEDTFTSIYIQEFECIARDTKLGKEEITRDIPNVGEEALKDLDSSGIVRIGAEVKPGDILVGKVTPKGETQLSPSKAQSPPARHPSVKRPATCGILHYVFPPGILRHRDRRAGIRARRHGTRPSSAQI